MVHALATRFRKTTRTGRVAALILSGVAVAALVCCPSYLWGHQEHSGAEYHLKVVCSTTLFRGLDSGELISSANVWIQSIGKHAGFVNQPEIALVANAREMRKQVDDSATDLVVSSSLEYLALDRLNVLKPAVAMTAGSGDRGKIKYLLIVSREGGISQLTDLKGKSLNTYSRSESNLNRLWLEVLLQGEHLAPADQYFGNAASSPKPSAACLPVFFGKVNACLIDDASWDTLRELNPQLQTKLRVLAESKPMIESLISIHARRQLFRTEVLRGIDGLQDDPEGRQVLLLFKCRRTVSIDIQDLAEVAELRSTYLKNTLPAERKVALPTTAPTSAPGNPKVH